MSDGADSITISPNIDFSYFFLTLSAVVKEHSSESQTSRMGTSINSTASLC